MKRTPLPRHRPLSRGRKGLKRSGKIKSSNPTRQAKRRKTYAQKLAAYRRGETYKVVEKRAGGRCERVHEWWSDMHDRDMEARCAYRGKLIHNHKTYARFGGQELPEDMEALCPTCNDAYESEKRPWNRNRRHA